MDVANIILSGRELNKSYGSFLALRGVDFDLRKGEVHALMGQNGAGKSTFIKLLAGAETPTAGVITIDGQPCTFKSPADASRAGISVVYQDLSLVPDMTVADNIFLGREPTNVAGVVRTGDIQRKTKELLERYGFPLDPTAKVGDLPFAFKQMTEIAKALLVNAQVLILDEPTSALTEGEEAILFDAVRKVVAQGVSVIYVTHRMQEVFKICDRVTVFRDGKNVETSLVKDINMEMLVASIIGNVKHNKPRKHEALEPLDLAARRKSILKDMPVLELRNVVNSRLKGISLTVKSGEIVGLAGALGSGRTEILQTIFGLLPVPVDSGEVILRGKSASFRGPMDAINAGIGLVPEDRHAEGLVLQHSVERNLSLPFLHRLTRLGTFLKKTAYIRAGKTMGELRVKASSSATFVSTLSGGNQQKVVLGKWFNPLCSLLLLDEPTVGVDVGAREEIYSNIRSAVSEGSAVLVVSSDLAELLLICDRIYIVNEGVTTGHFFADEIDGEETLHHAIHQMK
jgi:ribose transport system ATP-binding protein